MNPLIPTSMKGMIAYILSFNTVLTALSYWMTTFGNMASNIGAGLVTIAGLIISYYTILNLREKLLMNRLDRKLKEHEVKQKLKENG